MPTMELVVDGMRCRRCVRQATALLRDVAGVETVVADSRTSRIVITGDVTEEDVRTALAHTTFRVRTER